MGENPFEPSIESYTSDSAVAGDVVENRRRVLELQLIKVRNEANAARLEARAAELELMIRQLCGDASEFPPATPAVFPALSAPAENAGEPFHRFESWGAVEALIAPEPSADQATLSSQSPSEGSESAAATTPPTELRTSSPAPRGTDNETPRNDERANEPHIAEGVAVSLEFLSDHSAAAGLMASEVVLHDQSDAGDSETAVEDSGHRRKPAAWLVSAVFHIAAFIVLAFIGLQTQRPKDQIALSASASQSSETSIETFTIEATEPTPDTSEPTPSETEVQWSPLGELAATQLAPDANASPPSPLAASMSNSASASAAMSLESDSDAKIQFCGVEGGGNHFVYLVDSSKSMGDAFESARRELLASINALKPDQRFYVIFFDAESDYMRLVNPTADEPRSVEATDENKAALRRWAMRIGMDNGRAPYDPLRFALQLKPDVIFLLSDGEFPQGIEDLLRDENKTENLFGDRNLISIVHTIGYHSREGESRMRRIAAQNRGQYRHIPKR